MNQTKLRDHMVCLRLPSSLRQIKKLELYSISGPVILLLHQIFLFRSEKSLLTFVGEREKHVTYILFKMLLKFPQKVKPNSQLFSSGSQII